MLINELKEEEAKLIRQVEQNPKHRDPKNMKIKIAYPEPGNIAAEIRYHIENEQAQSPKKISKPVQSVACSKILERWFNDGMFNIRTGHLLPTETEIGRITSITPDMEFSFELKIEDMNSCIVDNPYWVLWIPDWFNFNIKKSTEESKFYISHIQDNGLGKHLNIRQSNQISYANNWQKEFLLKILMT